MFIKRYLQCRPSIPQMGLLKSIKSRADSILGPLRVEEWKNGISHDSLRRWANRHFLIQAPQDVEKERKNERYFLSLGLPVPVRPPSIEVINGNSKSIHDSHIISKDSLFYSKAKEYFTLLFCENYPSSPPLLKEIIENALNWTHLEIIVWALRSSRYLGLELDNEIDISSIFIKKCFHLHRNNAKDINVEEISNTQSSFEWGFRDGPLAMILLQVFSRELNHPLILTSSNLLVIVEEMEKTLQIDNNCFRTNFYHLLTSLIVSRLEINHDPSDHSMKLLLNDALNRLKEEYFVNK